MKVALGLGNSDKYAPMGRPRQGREPLAVAAPALVPAACAARGGPQIGHVGAPDPAGTFPGQRCTGSVPKARACPGASGVGETCTVGDLRSCTSCRFVSAHPNAGGEPRPIAGAT
jgi:hypothetical protein